jgi:hypothetical protein
VLQGQAHQRDVVKPDIKRLAAFSLVNSHFAQNGDRELLAYEFGFAEETTGASLSSPLGL